MMLGAASDQVRSADMGRSGTGSGRVRIIGGQLRGRRLPVAAQPGLRPTPDRVRETLFNWLQNRVAGSRCLDLFAGTGALGLEAHSRGAAEVVLIERSEPAVRRLRETISSWGLADVTVERAEALSWLERSSRVFDIVFLDPPFASGLLEPVCRTLARGGRLERQAHVYLEQAARGEPLRLPLGWEALRSGRAGDVQFALIEVVGPEN